MSNQFTSEEVRILKKICENPIFKKCQPLHVEKILPLKRLRIEICNDYDISEIDFLSRRRDKHLVDARKQFVKQAVNLGKYSTKQIGKAFGKDQATVYHYLKKENQ